MRKSRRASVFIGASSESLEIAYALQANLEYSMDVEVWTQGIFALSEYPIESLLESIGKCDFGIFVFSPDDTVIMRGKTAPAARDNVILELGMFLGRLGRKRSFVVMPRGSDQRLPSDLQGWEVAKYDARQENLQAALGGTCFRIRQRMKSESN